MNAAGSERVVSAILVTAQALGALLLAATLAYLARLFRTSFARTWAVGFAALAAALLSVRAFIAFGGRGWWALYLVSEWTFSVCVASGARELVGDGRTRPGRLFGALPLAALAAGVLVSFPGTFNALFSGQALVVSGMAAFTFVTLGAVPAAERTAGWQLVRIALATITILFFLYVPLFSLPSAHALLSGLATYSSMADLVAETLLGIGMVLVLSEGARRKLESAVRDLKRARDEIEAAARLDPLTEAFNRHAFHSFAGPDGPAAGSSGAVVMLDVDSLKPINDTDGHAAGDAALRAVARAVRALIRPEDLLFRWGGDEFLVVLPRIDPAAADARFQALAPGIETDTGRGARTVKVSWGASEFSKDRSLTDAIAAADRAMYAARGSRGRARADSAG